MSALCFPRPVVTTLCVLLRSLGLPLVTVHPGTPSLRNSFCLAQSDKVWDKRSRGNGNHQKRRSKEEWEEEKEEVWNPELDWEGGVEKEGGPSYCRNKEISSCSRPSPPRVL